MIKTNHPPELISNTNINAQQPKRIVIVTFHINIHSYTITPKQQQYPEPGATNNNNNNKNSCEICSIERLIFWFSCRIQAIKFQHTDARSQKNFSPGFFFYCQRLINAKLWKNFVHIHNVHKYTNIDCHIGLLFIRWRWVLNTFYFVVKGQYVCFKPKTAIILRASFFKSELKKMEEEKRYRWKANCVSHLQLLIFVRAGSYIIRRSLTNWITHA